MNWTTLIIATVICYVIYYGVVMGIDLLKNKNGVKDKGLSNGRYGLRRRDTGKHCS